MSRLAPRSTRGIRRRATPAQERRTRLRRMAAAGLAGLGLFAGLVAGRIPSRLVAHLARQGGQVLDQEAAAAVLACCILAGLGLRHILFQSREIRAWRLAHRRARQHATHCNLTNLPNRRRLQAELALALARVRRGRGPAALLLVNLNRFGAVNHLHGAYIGDRLLRAVADRISGSLRETDVAARLSGDEFAVVAELRTPEDAMQLAERLMTELAIPFTIDGTELRLGCRIGIATAPGDAHTPDMLLRHAAVALQRAERDGDGRICFFQHGMEERVRQRAELQQMLGRAVAEDRILLHYQPLLDLRTRRIHGFEALARWWHPQRGTVSPSEFIPVAEEMGLMTPLTNRLLRLACRAALDWPAEMVVAVNISASQLCDPALPDRVRQVLAETGLPARRLELEITETALVSDFDAARGIAGQLKAIGVRLALDDFGTGHSSLRFLQAVPFDKIKIDAGFVQSIGSHSESGRIVASVIALAHSLGIPSVAEGIETEAQAAALLKLGCDIGQGWWFGRPMPAEAARAIFAGVG